MIILRILVRELFETIILALSVFVVLNFSVQNFRVEGPSMEPTLNNGEHLLVNKLTFHQLPIPGSLSFLSGQSIENDRTGIKFDDPEYGDVIIFRFPRDPTRDFVKRVIGLPGDTVEIRNGQVLVNDQWINEPYLTNRGSTTRRLTVVPENTFYVLGDNRRHSLDSREWGTVPRENIIGRGLLRYWPLSDLDLLSIFRGKPFLN